MKKSLVLFAWASVISSHCLLSAANFTWNGSTDTDWDTHSNWTPAGGPSTNDNTSIPIGSPNNPLINVATVNNTIANLTMLSSGSLTINAFNLTVSGLIGSGGSIDLQNGSFITVNNTVSCTFSGLISGTSDDGLIKQGSGSLTLSNANTYVGGSQIEAGTLIVKNNTALGSGAVVMSSGSTLSLSNLIILPNNISTSGMVSFSVPSGTAIMNGGTLAFTSFDKIGVGTLAIPGTATFTGDSGVIAGTLNIDGALTSPSSAASLTVDGTLSGTGSVTANSVIYTGGGILHPGNSPGHITLNGDQFFQYNPSTMEGSIFQVEIDNAATPQNSEAIITGNITIDQGALVDVLSIANYPTVPHTYVIATYTGTRSGEFLLTSAGAPVPPAQQFALTYPANQIDLNIDVFFPPHHRNQIPAANGFNHFVEDPCGNSPAIVDALAYIPTLKALDAALLSTQPSALTSLAIAQQDAQLYVRNAIYNRLEEPLHSCCTRGLNKICLDSKETAQKEASQGEKRAHPKTKESKCTSSKTNRINLWVSGMMAHTSQHNQHSEPGFIANTPGVFLGADGLLGLRSAVGAGVGYTYSHLNWKQNRGKGNVQTVYLSTYGLFSTPRAYIESALIGGYSFYKADRHMEFGLPHIYYINTSAHNTHNGFDGSAHFRTGLKYGCAHWVVSPFAGLDYIATYEDSFTESGAQSLNLHVSHHFSQLLTSEAGVDLSYCWSGANHSISPFLKLSAIRESRFGGASEHCHFTCGGYSMHVKGLAPSRTLAGIGSGLNGTFGLNTLSLSYQGKVNSHFTDNAFSLEYLRKF